MTKEIITLLEEELCQIFLTFQVRQMLSRSFVTLKRSFKCYHFTWYRCCNCFNIDWGWGSDSVCLPKISHKRTHAFFMGIFLSGHSWCEEFQTIPLARIIREGHVETNKTHKGQNLSHCQLCKQTSFQVMPASNFHTFQLRPHMFGRSSTPSLQYFLQSHDPQ